MRTETKPPVDCCATEAVAEHQAGEPAADGLGRLVTVFKALSDQTRLRILSSLVRSGGPLCECEIVPAFGLSQPTISYHLKVLREAGLVEADRRGIWAYYRPNHRALLGVMKELAELG